MNNMKQVFIQFYLRVICILGLIVFYYFIVPLVGHRPLFLGMDQSHTPIFYDNSKSHEKILESAFYFVNKSNTGIDDIESRIQVVLLEDMDAEIWVTSIRERLRENYLRKYIIENNLVSKPFDEVKKHISKTYLTIWQIMFGIALILIYGVVFFLLNKKLNLQYEKDKKTISAFTVYNLFFVIASLVGILVYHIFSLETTTNIIKYSLSISVIAGAMAILGKTYHSFYHLIESLPKKPSAPKAS
jgi:hypothetical protein